MSNRRKQVNAYSGKGGLPRPYRPAENYRNAIQGNLKIDRDCWEKTEKEKQLLKCLKANAKVKRDI